MVFIMPKIGMRNNYGLRSYPVYVEMKTFEPKKLRLGNYFPLVEEKIYVLGNYFPRLKNRHHRRFCAAFPGEGSADSLLCNSC